MNEDLQQFRVEKDNGIERFYLDAVLLALIIRAEHQESGIAFYTPDKFSQQLAFMHHPSSHEILPHVHNPVPRSVEFTQEVLFIRKGKVRMDLYSSQRDYLQSCMLSTGDIVLLAHGGHGFKVLDNAEIIEVKQGPYAGEADKTRFPAIAEENVRLLGE